MNKKDDGTPTSSKILSMFRGLVQRITLVMLFERNDIRKWACWCFLVAKTVTHTHVHSMKVIILCGREDVNTYFRNPSEYLKNAIDKIQS